MTISRAEWATAALLALLVLAITGLPYLAGWLASTPDRVFEGFVIDVDDAHSHLAKMQQGYRGDWQFRLLFTPEQHSGAYINTFYIALGHVARLMGQDLVLIYHAARLLSGLIFLLTAYAFTAYFLSERDDRRLAYILICFSSGLGWLALLVSGSFVTGTVTPVDFWLIEMYSFFTVMVFPHISMVIVMLLAAFGLVLSYLESGGSRAIIGATICTLGLCLIHPFTLLVINLTLAGYWLHRTLRRRRLWLEPLPGIVLLALAPLPLTIYQYTAIAGNPVFVAWQAQNSTLSPPPWHYALGYGVVLALAIPGGWWAWRLEKRWPLLPLWLLIVAPLLYAPNVFNLQRRLVEGAQVPLCILATVGMMHYVLPAVGKSRLAAALSRRGYAAKRLELLVRNLLLGLTIPSTLFLILSASLAAANGLPELVHSSGEIAAVDWLGANSEPDDTVLASYDIGGLIPARIGHRVFMGHWAETVNLSRKRADAEHFFAAASDDERRALLRQHTIAYVFHGPRERVLGRFDPTQASYLTLVFTSHTVSIYKVNIR